MQAVDSFPWPTGSDGEARALLGLLPLAATLSQRVLPYHVPGVESNDILYAADSSFRVQAPLMC